MRVQFADVKDVVVEGPRRVRFNFKTTENRELPLVVGGLPVLPKHFFDGRDFTKPLTDARSDLALTGSRRSSWGGR